MWLIRILYMGSLITLLLMFMDFGQWFIDGGWAKVLKEMIFKI